MLQVKGLFTHPILRRAIDILEYVFNWREHRRQTAVNHKRGMLLHGLLWVYCIQQNVNHNVQNLTCKEAFTICNSRNINMRKMCIFPFDTVALKTKSAIQMKCLLCFDVLLKQFLCWPLNERLFLRFFASNHSICDNAWYLRRIPWKMSHIKSSETVLRVYNRNSATPNFGAHVQVGKRRKAVRQAS